MQSSSLSDISRVGSFQFHKQSEDGSGKCNILKSQSDSDIVYGVVFEVPESQIAALDKVEGGYVRKPIEVLCDGAPSIPASVYIAESPHINSTPTPYAWYRDLVLAGARAAQFPSALR